jgi:hypothetical protein
MVTIKEIRATQKVEKQARLNAKPGDKWFRFVPFNPTVEVEVTKITKTRIIFSDNSRISYTSGRVILLNRFSHRYYRPATEALRAEIDKELKSKKVDKDFQSSITRIQVNSLNWTLDQKLEFINLINGFIKPL